MIVPGEVPEMPEDQFHLHPGRAMVPCPPRWADPDLEGLTCPACGLEVRYFILTRPRPIGYCPRCGIEVFVRSDPADPSPAPQPDPWNNRGRVGGTHGL